MAWSRNTRDNNEFGLNSKRKPSKQRVGERVLPEKVVKEFRNEFFLHS